MVVGKEGRRGEAERETVGTEVWQGIKFAQNILNDYFLYKVKYCKILTLTFPGPFLIETGSSGGLFVKHQTINVMLVVAAFSTNDSSNLLDVYSGEHSSWPS